MIMMVYNVNGVRHASCRCESERVHWEKYNDRMSTWPKYCCARRCRNLAAVTASVQQEPHAGGPWYVIPLCEEHAGASYSGKALEVCDSTPFSSVGACVEQGPGEVVEADLADMKPRLYEYVG